MKKIISLLMLILLLALLTSCKKEDKKIILASKPMTEQFIIAEMLIALIEQHTDITVEHKSGVGGGTSSIHPAMISGKIDIYPEYTGTGQMFVLKQKLINNPEKLYQSVKKSYQEKFNIYWSELYGFNDTFGIAMKKELADKLDIKTYSDLAEKGVKLTFGAEHDFFERNDGFPGIDSVYNFNFKKNVGMDIGLKYQAIESGEVDVINIFSTDGKLKKFKMVVLQDNKNYFPSYFAATLIRQETINKYPELQKVVSRLDNAINNQEMTEMNYLVEVQKKQPQKVALEFLKRKGLLK